MSSIGNRHGGADRRSWLGRSAHLGLAALLVCVLAPLWTADRLDTLAITATVPVVVLYALMWVLIALARAYRRTSPLSVDRTRRFSLRLAQWAAGIMCAVYVPLTLYALSWAYASVYGEPAG
ncbi:hypothetical protein ACFWVC_35860 [Streptomyces sp. NPDC058691]|uniref:hypothetical protein n=1 Tax=Streptomyces sp. NPDC058691 TaxID=3346601 RepID=UPI003658E4AF